MKSRIPDPPGSPVVEPRPDPGTPGSPVEESRPDPGTPWIPSYGIEARSRYPPDPLISYNRGDPAADPHVPTPDNIRIYFNFNDILTH